MQIRGAIARHYWRDTYADILAKRDLLIGFLRSKGYRADKAKIHPREAAKLAGLAFIGRNALAINPTYGSWALYYALVTDAELEPSPRLDKGCPKNCRRCMDACPTRALVEPYVLNVNRCLNYIMEEQGPVQSWAREAIGNRINGCDTCQDACPFNAKPRHAPEPITARLPDSELVPWPKLRRCFSVTQEEMEKNYGFMDWYEPKVRYLRRNALIAVGNSGAKELAPLARRLERSKNPVLRDHAVWALRRLA
ncbi:MAG: epoxyqueuosine reductase [Thermoplasmata archaeon]